MYIALFTWPAWSPLASAVLADDVAVAAASAPTAHSIGSLSFSVAMAPTRCSNVSNQRQQRSITQYYMLVQQRTLYSLAHDQFLQCAALSTQQYASHYVLALSGRNSNHN
jgi:hypothetical protein